MKKQLLKSMFLLCALIVGSSNVWAQAPVNTVLWSEDFSGYSNNVDPSGSITNSHAGTTVYDGVTLTYSKNNGGGTTQTYTSGGPNGNANLLIAKNNGSFSISGISTGDAIELTVTYAKSGSGSIAISSSTTGVTISGSASGSVITTNGAATLQLTFTNTNESNNLRIDDISVKVKTAGTGGGGIAAPTFTVAEGAVTAGTTVELEQADDKTIRYTTDGTEPAKTVGTVYDGTPIVITTPITIKAIAVDGDNVSSVSVASYTINVAKPSFDVAAGNVDEGTLLTITAAVGNTIIYTVDGTDPSYESSVGDIYDSPIAINTPMTVKAIAVDAYDNESEITSAAYTVSYPGGVDITPNYTFFGKTGNFSGSTYDEVTGTQDGIIVTYTRNEGSCYANSTAMRFYKDNDLRIDAPAGKVITTVSINTVTTDVSSTPDGYEGSTGTWTGSANSVTLSRSASASSYVTISKITVVLANKVTLAVACTDGEKYYSTYSSSKAFKVPADLTVSEISVSDGKLNLSDYNTGDVVPANTGVLIASSTSGDHTLAIAMGGTSKLGSSNMLKASGDAGINAATMNEADTKFYRLTMHNGTQIGFWWGAAEGAAFDVAANKAYLAVPNGSGAREGLWFSDDVTTGINAVENAETVKAVYNLAGQRVAQPTRGLYIVNGKKIVIK